MTNTIGIDESSTYSVTRHSEAEQVAVSLLPMGRPLIDTVHLPALSHVKPAAPLIPFTRLPTAAARQGRGRGAPCGRASKGCQPESARVHWVGGGRLAWGRGAEVYCRSSPHALGSFQHTHTHTHTRACCAKARTARCSPCQRCSKKAPLAARRQSPPHKALLKAPLAATAPPRPRPSPHPHRGPSRLTGAAARGVAVAGGVLAVHLEPALGHGAGVHGAQDLQGGRGREAASSQAAAARDRSPQRNSGQRRTGRAVASVAQGAATDSACRWLRWAPHAAALQQHVSRAQAQPARAFRTSVEARAAALGGRGAATHSATKPPMLPRSARAASASPWPRRQPAGASG